MIREAIAATKPKFVVMMVGLNDRVVDPRSRAAGAQPRAPRTQRPCRPPRPPRNSRRLRPTRSPMPRMPSSTGRAPAIAAPEPQPKAASRRRPIASTNSAPMNGPRTYTKRIDATIAALKSAGVPVFWVGLPSIRGPKSTSDMQYLNDLYRARAEKAGIIYIDVWDGFVDDGGRFIPQGAGLRGPDPPAARRRRRAFHQGRRAQARALSRARNPARAWRRAREPVALPSSEPQAPAVAAKPSGPAARPLAGPVVPLTASVTSGAGVDRRRATPAIRRTPKSVTRVLVNGEAIAPPAGRSGRFRMAAPRHRAGRRRSGRRHHHGADPGHEAGAANHGRRAERGGSPGRRGQSARRADGRPPAARAAAAQWQQHVPQPAASSRFSG